MAVTWVVVAESSRARILESRSPLGVLTEIHSMEHPEARLREHELVSDNPGSQFVSQHSHRHGAPEPVSWHDEHALRFARELGEHLERSRATRRYDRLVLSAAPRFLGLLRGELTAATRAHVTHEFGKDWIQETPERIRAHLVDAL